MDINIEDETIKMDNWKTIVTLKEEIKEKVIGNDFDVSDEAIALKELTETMSKYDKIELKLPKVFIEKCKADALDKDISFWELLREKLLD